MPKNIRTRPRSQRAKVRPKFHKIPEIILLIRGGIAQDSLSGYWERSDQFIGLGLHRRRLRHLPEGYTRLLRLP